MCVRLTRRAPPHDRDPFANPRRGPFQKDLVAGFVDKRNLRTTGEVTDNSLPCRQALGAAAENLTGKALAMSNTFAVRKSVFLQKLPERTEGSCPARGKIAYATRHDAMDVATEMNRSIPNRKRRRGIEGKASRWKAFKCPHCNHWHVGRETRRTEFTRKNQLEAFQ